MDDDDDGDNEEKDFKQQILHLTEKEFRHEYTFSLKRMRWVTNWNDQNKKEYLPFFNHMYIFSWVICKHFVVLNNRLKKKKYIKKDKEER